MIVQWLENQVVSFARELAVARAAISGFEAKIHDMLARAPIQEWEADRWWRGIQKGLIKPNGHFYRVGSGKNGSLSLFVRNEHGVNVGLRRESITQMSTYVSLITDFGFPRRSTRFESRWMDVVVYSEGNTPLIYAENKASEKTLRKLCARLERDFSEGLPFLPESEDMKVEDAVMKAQHILRNRPLFFWAVSPTYRCAYSVSYHDPGFSLSPIENIPAGN